VIAALARSVDGHISSPLSVRAPRSLTRAAGSHSDSPFTNVEGESAMQYFFRGAWHQVPIYSPYHGCRRFSIEYTFPIRRITIRDERIVQRSWRKLISFLLAEGATTTIRKVRSKLALSKLTSDYYVVFAVGRGLEIDNDTIAEASRPTYLCLGTRHPACAEVMLFANDLSTSIDCIPSRPVLAAAISRTLAQRTEAVDEIAGYNLYSDLPVPTAALQLLHRVAALIGSVQQQQSDGADSDLPESIEPPQRRDGVETRGEHKQLPRQKRSVGGAAVIAGGDYVRTDVIPALKRGGFPLRVIADLQPHIAEYVKEHFGFERAETDWRRALDETEADTVVIATFHDSHATIAADALRRGKKVLLEKPPAVTREDLGLLLQAARTGGFLDIGYCRRYAAFARTAKRLLSQAQGPTTIAMVVREVECPPQHWYRWPKEGTRVTGNLCHWIDLAVFLLGLGPVPQEISVSAPVERQLDEERTFSIVYDDGTSVTIVATQRGDPTLGVQELIDIRRGDLTIRIDDFRRLDATRLGHRIRRSHFRRDKGHRAMYDEMLRRVKTDQPPLYTTRELEVTTLLTILATEMVRSGTGRVAVSRHDLVSHVGG
jgi:predicted dehydrogenase